ncbi:MAG TPA: hypothetical protein VHX42_02510 [Candidatus Babeliales bacterium]|jgi:hypothetical protein|nr:hypothetical protein [Candidatus Babeliales bacterium]
MACSTISTRIILNTLILIVLLFSPSLFLQANVGLEITYNNHDHWQLFLSGSYKTNYLDTNVKINPYKSFPDNIIITFEPTITKSANQKILADNLEGLTNASLNLGKYYFKKKYYHDKELEDRVESSYLKKHKKNLQLLKEASHG